MSKPRVEALIARLEKGKQKTHEILSGLPADQWQRAVYTDPCPWTVRDLLAHFVSAEEALLRLAQDAASGWEGVPKGFDYDAFNAEEQKRLADQSPQDLLAALAVARQTTLDWVCTLGEDDLDRMGWHPALGETSLEMMLSAIYGHQLLHMRDLQRAMG